MPLADGYGWVAGPRGARSGVFLWWLPRAGLGARFGGGENEGGGGGDPGLVGVVLR